MNEQAIPMIGQSPTRLLSLLQSWVGTPRPEMSHLLLVSISVLPYGETSPEFWADLNKTLTQCRERNDGTLYDLSESERALLFKLSENKELSITTELRVNLLRLIQRHFPDHFGLVDQSRLLRVVNLSKRLVNAIALVERYKEAVAEMSVPDREGGAAETAAPVPKVKKESKPERLRSLHINDIKLLEDVSHELGARDFARAFIRSQELAEIVPGKNPVHVMRELYASMDLLRRHALKGVEMRGSGNLFNQLTILLDQIVLASFQQSNPDAVRCSLNMNVESVFTRGFETFIETTGPADFANILFEFRQANIIQNFDEFSVACDLIRSHGGRIAVDAIFPETVGLVNLNRLNVEMVKVFWRQNAETVLPKCRDDIRAMQDAGVRFVLARVDDQTALDIGQELGVTLFQGFYVDRLLSGLAPLAAS
ncbi:MAG: EAL domain-containing protein [Rhodospirillales bacterium]|nr:EAL domain-containing protein [Rhodospirillales bacterium]